MPPAPPKAEKLKFVPPLPPRVLTVCACAVAPIVAPSASQTTMLAKASAWRPGAAGDEPPAPPRGARANSEATCITRRLRFQTK